MKCPDITSLVPHSNSMLLLDRVISADKDSLCAEVIIRPESLFYERGGVGAWIGIEYMAQTVAAYAGYHAHLNNEPVKIGFLIGSRQYECHKNNFENGCILKITARCIYQADNGLGSFECTIHTAEGEVARATLNAFLPDNVKSFLEELN